MGRGGTNNPEEVKIIQQALNRIGPGLGGPSPKLVPDGIVGTKTIGAIEKFQSRQLGFFDGRVDPNNKTINRINQLALTIFVTVDPRIIKKIYDELLPEVRLRSRRRRRAAFGAQCDFAWSRTPTAQYRHPGLGE